MLLILNFSFFAFLSIHLNKYFVLFILRRTDMSENRVSCALENIADSIKEITKSIDSIDKNLQSIKEVLENKFY